MGDRNQVQAIPLEFSRVGALATISEHHVTKLEWAKGVPIRDVAQALGLEIVGTNARCWRASNHTHADQTPSLGLDTNRNRWKCFVCDKRSASVVDLVIGVLSLDLSDAVKWMAEHFTVPADVVGTVTPRRISPDLDRVSFETIVKSGVWAQWTDSQRAIFGVLWAHQETDGTVKLGYGDILRFSGRVNRHTVVDTTRFFEAARLIDVRRAFKRQSVYVFLEHGRFLQLQRESLARFNAAPSSASSDNLVSNKDTRSNLVSVGTPPTQPKGKRVLVLGHQISEDEEQVLHLALARGFRLLPCKPRTKKPAVKNWQQLATGDALRLKKWIRAFPGANWAVAAGKDSGVFILDVDGDEGLESLRDLCSLAEFSISKLMASTLGVKTSRGLHLYFKWPSDGVPTSVKLLGAGLDVRGRGSYACCPPSTHESGAKYEWLAGEPNRPIAEAPTWLLAKIVGYIGRQRGCDDNPETWPAAKTERTQ